MVFSDTLKPCVDMDIPGATISRESKQLLLTI